MYQLGLGSDVYGFCVLTLFITYEVTLILLAGREDVSCSETTLGLVVSYSSLSSHIQICSVPYAPFYIIHSASFVLPIRGNWEPR